MNDERMLDRVTTYLQHHWLDLLQFLFVLAILIGLILLIGSSVVSMIVQRNDHPCNLFSDANKWECQVAKVNECMATEQFTKDQCVRFLTR